MRIYIVNLAHVQLLVVYFSRHIYSSNISRKFLDEHFSHELMVFLRFPGVPLPLIGMFAYGFVTIFGIQLAGRNFPFKMDENNARLILLGSTTSMAAASAYFLYILSTKFAGASCSYCLLSALLSFSLFFTTLKVSLVFR